MSAILIAVTGLYGLMAYAVNQRRQEIGVRMAIGATLANIVLLVMRRGQPYHVARLLHGSH